MPARLPCCNARRRGCCSRGCCRETRRHGENEKARLRGLFVDSMEAWVGIEPAYTALQAAA
jgi:hypothetical protein